MQFFTFNKNTKLQFVILYNFALFAICIFLLFAIFKNNNFHILQNCKILIFHQLQFFVICNFVFIEILYYFSICKKVQNYLFWNFHHLQFSKTFKIFSVSFLKKGAKLPISILKHLQNPEKRWKYWCFSNQKIHFSRKKCTFPIFRKSCGRVRGWQPCRLT